MTDREAQAAALGWIAGVLATATAVLVSYLLWWHAERNRS